MTDTIDDDQDVDDWALLKRRVLMPIQQETFFVALGAGVLVIGYLAVWVELSAYWGSLANGVPNLVPLRLAYSTAILAVAGPAFFQLVLTRDIMAINAAIVSFLLVAVAAFQASYGPSEAHFVHIFGAVGLILAVLMWWLANGEDELYRDRPKPNAGSGGDPMRDLSGSVDKVKL